MILPSRNEIVLIIKSFGIKPKRIQRLVTSGNIAFYIQTSKEKYFLRLCPDGHRWRSKKEIKAEIELLAYLHKKGLPVEVPLSNKCGERVIFWNNHFGYIRKFVKGKEKLNPTVSDVRRFGELLGRFHTAIKRFKTTHARTHVFDVPTTVRHFKEDVYDIEKSGGPERRAFIIMYKRFLKTLYFSSSLPMGTIHEDLGKRHILWNKDRIVQIIDFDRAYYGPLILDVGQACRGWCFDSNWRRWNNTRFKALMEGYFKHRVLTAGERKSLISAIQFAILERSLAFALHYVYGNRDATEWNKALDGLFVQMSQIEYNKIMISTTMKTL